MNEWIKQWTTTMLQVGAIEAQQLALLQAKLYEPALQWYRRRPADDNGEPWTITNTLDDIRNQYALPKPHYNAPRKKAKPLINTLMTFNKQYTNTTQTWLKPKRSFLEGLDPEIAKCMIPATPPLTLQHALTMTRTFEAELKNIQDKHKLPPTSNLNYIDNIINLETLKTSIKEVVIDTVNEVYTKNNNNNSNYNPNYNSNYNPNKQNYDDRHKIGGHTLGTTCYYCKKPNHLSTQCKKKEEDKINETLKPWRGGQSRRD